MLAVHTAEDRVTYGSFVESVLAQVEAGLQTNRTTTDAADTEDPLNQVAKRLKVSKTDLAIQKKSKSYQAADARFALASNDSVYLSNAVSLLCADLANGVEEPLPTGTVFGPEVIDGVKRAIEADARRRAQKKKHTDPRKLEQCVEVVLWMLSVQEIRLSVFLFLDRLDNVPRLRKQYTDNRSTGDTAWDDLLRKFQSDPFDQLTDSLRTMVQRASAEKSLELKLFKLVVVGLSALLKHDSPPVQLADAIIDDIKQQTADVAQAPERILSSTAAVAPSGETKEQVAAGIDDRRRLETLFQVDISTRYSGRDVMSMYCEQRGLVGRNSPIDTTDGHAYGAEELRYSLPAHQRGAAILGLASAASDFQGVPLCDEEADHVYFSVDVDEAFASMNRNYAMMPIDGADTKIEREHTLTVRWLPDGEMAKETSTAVALELAIQKVESMISSASDSTNAALLAATAASLKLKQLKDLYAVKREFARFGRHVYVNDEPSPDIVLVTKPVLHSDVGGTSIPVYDAATGVVQRSTDEDELDLQGGDSPDELMESIKTLGHYFGDIGLARDGWEGDGRKELHGYAVSLITEAEGIASSGCLEDEQISVHRMLGALACTSSLIDSILASGHPSSPSRDPHMPTPITPPVKAVAGSAEAIRGSLWSDMLRELSISNDRMWVFIRTLSGCIGEEANSLLNAADEQAQAAQRAFEVERKAIAEKVAAFQSKLIETVVGSVLRTSKLEVQPNGQELVIIDAEAAKDLRALASGESGRPYFEASVAISGIIEQQKGTKTSLTEMIASFNDIVHQVHDKLLADLQGNTATSRTVSVADLALPRNSYFVSLKADVVTAIRTSLDRVRHETRSERPSLYELVEGACPSLCLRFAELVGHVLVQIRSTTGVSALYVSQQQQYNAALHARSAMNRLMSEIRGYLVVNPPSFELATGREDYLRDVAQKGLANGCVGHGSAIVGRVHVAQLVTNMPRHDGWTGRYQWSLQHAPSGYGKA
jgi:hypothetical protein